MKLRCHHDWLNDDQSYNQASCDNVTADLTDCVRCVDLYTEHMKGSVSHTELKKHIIGQDSFIKVENISHKDIYLAVDLGSDGSARRKQHDKSFSFLSLPVLFLLCITL